MTAALPSTTGGETSGIASDAALNPMGRYAVDVDRLSDIIGNPSTTSSELSPLTTQLQASIVEQKSALNASIVAQSALVSKHLSQAAELRTAVEGVNSRLVSMVQEFHARNPQKLGSLNDFVGISSTLSAGANDQAIASTTLNALNLLQSKFGGLVALEDALWAGKGANREILAALVTQRDTSCSVQSQVAAAIDNRQTVLLSMVTEQLSNAWAKSVSFSGQAGKPARLSVKTRIRLALPHVPRVTPASPVPPETPPLNSSTDLIESLSVLNVLPARLQEIHTRLVHDVISPFIKSGQWRPILHSDEAANSLEMNHVGEQSPTAIVNGVKVILTFIATSLVPSIIDPAATTTSSPRDKFLSGIQRDTFQQLLGEVIVPAMPSALRDLPDWLQMVQQAADCEEALQPSADTYVAVLREFVDREAGGRWLARRRNSLLRDARRITYNNWKSSTFHQVDVVDSPPATPATALKPIPVEHVTATETTADDATNELDDDGWGFEEESSATPAAPAPIEPAVAATFDDDMSGWDFDDVATPVAAEPIANPKPTREAKRLGKRVKHAGSANQSTSADSTPPPEEEETVPSLPDSPIVAPPSPPARALLPPQTHWRRISDVCDEVVGLASSAAAEMEALSSLSLPNASFAFVRTGMTEHLAELLDFIRATTPIAYPGSGTTPAAGRLQLSNDFEYIGKALGESLAPEALGDAQNRKFKAAATTIRQSFVQSQLGVSSSLLMGTNRFVGTSNEDIFAMAETSVAKLTVHLTDLGRDLTALFEPERRYALLGTIVEEVVVQAVDDILALEDITETESERISALVSQVETLDSLFADHQGVSTIVTFVPHWLKLCYTNEILRANLVDITYLFENGSLVDFTPQELARLVRALFADSQKRHALLEKIERASQL